MKPQTPRGSSQKMANSLVALSSAAVLTVYAAGYLRTRPAAERFAVEAARRETKSPAAATTATPPAASHQSPPAPAPTNLAIAPPNRTISPTASTSTAIPNNPTAVLPESPPALPSEAPPALQANEPTTPDGNITAEPASTPATQQEQQYKDGTYLGWGSCRHGDIQASIVLEGGRIVSAAIAQCLTRYSCSWIEALPSQVVSRQSTNVDYVSGATQSTDAFSDAIADALSKAK